MKSIVRHDRYYVVEVEPALVVETSVTDTFIGSKEARFANKAAALKAASAARRFLRDLAKTDCVIK